MTRRHLVLTFTVILAACAGGQESTGPVQRYEVDGILAQLPGEPSRELMIRHVAIPGFVSAGGDTIGMSPMTMGFPVAGGVDLAGFAAGDSVRFTFEVRWGGTPPLRLTSLRPLPPGTPIDFEKKH